MAKNYRETEPLLQNSRASSKQRSKFHFISCLPKEYKREALNIFHLAWPIIITSLSRFCNLTISIIMCGHLGELQLDVATLANGSMNVLGLAVNMGFTAAADTLFSQSIGCGNKKKASLFLQQCFVAALPILMVVTCVYLNIEFVWVSIGQNPLISKMASEFIILALPGIYFDCGFLILSRFMQNQGDVYPPMLSSLISNVINSVGQYFFIYVNHHEYHVSAIWQAISFGAAFICEIIYMLLCSKYRDAWNGWKPRAVFENLGQVYLLGIAGVLMSFTGELVYEVGTFAAGALGAVQLASQGITFQLAVLSTMFALGLSVAVNVRVGNQLGARNSQGAKFSYYIGLIMTMMSSGIVATLFIGLSNQLPLLFANDERVINMTSGIIRILGIFQFINSIVYVSSGALRGCGRQVIGSVVILVGFYVIALPIMLLMALATPLQVMGIWIGLGLGVGYQAFSLFTLLIQTDWKQQSSEALRRVEGEPPLPSEGTDIFSYSDMDSMSNTRGGETPTSSCQPALTTDELFSQSEPRRSSQESPDSPTDYRQFFSRTIAESYISLPARPTSMPKLLDDKIAHKLSPLILKTKPIFPREHLGYLILKRSLLFGITLSLLGVSIWTRSIYSSGLRNLCGNNGSGNSTCNETTTTSFDYV